MDTYGFRKYSTRSTAYKFALGVQLNEDMHEQLKSNVPTNHYNVKLKQFICQSQSLQEAIQKLPDNVNCTGIDLYYYSQLAKFTFNCYLVTWYKNYST